MEIILKERSNKIHFKPHLNIFPYLWKKFLEENGYHDYKELSLEHMSVQNQQQRINYVVKVMENLEKCRFCQDVLWAVLLVNC